MACTVEGCEKPTRSKSATLCKMHYHRMYRHGDVNTTARALGPAPLLADYPRMKRRGGHPVASKNGCMYAHRFILYEAIGPGPHACHWCATPVDWLPEGTPVAEHRTDGALHVDHLNGIRDDNRLANLVPSCPTCNTARAAQAKADALRAAGFWSGHDTVARTGKGRARRVT